MHSLTTFEADVLSALLAGDDPALPTLRRQVEHASVDSREFSGVGFFVHLRVGAIAKPLLDSATYVINDVRGELGGLQYGAAFALFIEAGYITMLEGFSIQEPWPEIIEDYHLYRA